VGAGAVAQSATPPPSTALVTQLVTAGLARDARLEVVTSGDVRKQLELEGEKQSAGCDEGSSACLAEVASALGATLVVYGTLGEIDGLQILTLNLFDSTASAPINRVVVQDASLRGLTARIDGATQELVATYFANRPAGARVKLLVMDLDSTSSAREADTVSPLLIAGAATAGVGVVVAGLGAGGLVLGALADGAADDLALSQADAKQKYAERNTWGALGFGGLGVGAAALAAGAALVVAATVVE
jgi:hypothetical protein